jgi:hypothetical protein
MAVLTLGLCNHVLSQLGDARAFRLGPRSSLAAVRELSVTRPTEVAALLDDARSPYGEEGASVVRRALAPRQGTGRARCYATFENFCHHVSRGKHVPSRDLRDLVPSVGPDHAVRQLISLSIPQIDVVTIRSMGSNWPRAFVAKTDSGATVFVYRGAILRAFSLEVVLRASLHALCWASGHPRLPPRLRYRSAPVPDSELARALTTVLALKAATACLAHPYTFYATVLIPEVVNCLGDLQGIIATQPVTPLADDDGEAEAGADPCPICLYNMVGGDAKLTSCGHLLHTECFEVLRARPGRLQCPICRLPL